MTNQSLSVFAGLDLLNSNTTQNYLLEIRAIMVGDTSQVGPCLVTRTTTDHYQVEAPRATGGYRVRPGARQTSAFDAANHCLDAYRVVEARARLQAA
jgi:hypothetical protein